MNKQQYDELMVVLSRIALAMEHTHKCEQEISQTLKNLEKIHKDWFKKTVGTKAKP